MIDQKRVIKRAMISNDGLYRYALLRSWDDSLPRMNFIMLNPSTADAEQDDPMIRRCLGFARSWDYGSIVVTNLYAFRATKPADLWKADDPVGPENDRHLVEAMMGSRGLIAAWGANARDDRVARVRRLLSDRNMFCLGVTKYGAPRHPLYVAGSTYPIFLWGAS